MSRHHFWHDCKLLFLFSHFSEVFSSLHELTCSSVTPDYAFWVPALLQDTKQELFWGGIRGEESDSQIGFSFQDEYRGEKWYMHLQSLKIQREKKSKNLKENVWNGNINAPYWSEPYPTAGSRNFTFDPSRIGPMWVSWSSPRIKIFWQKILVAIEFPLANCFPCTPQYMVLGYVPKLLEPSSAKYLFRFLSMAAKKMFNTLLWLKKVTKLSNVIKKYKKWKGLQHVFENNWLKLEGLQLWNCQFLLDVKEIVMTIVCLQSLGGSIISSRSS